MPDRKSYIDKNGDVNELDKGFFAEAVSGLPSVLRPVDNDRAATTPAIRSIPAAKLARVLSERVARLWASLIVAKTVSIRCRS